MDLSGKNALVTGGDQGIGQAIALRLGQAGANVALTYRSNREGGEKTRETIEAGGRRAAALQADVSKLEDVRRLIDDAVAAMGGTLDILVNNAGIEKRAPFLEVAEADYHLVLQVNLHAPFFLSQALAKHLVARKALGKIINISSVHEDLPFPNFAPYCVSKGGLRMMMRDLAIELAPHGITVNNIAPGAIETPINRKLLSDPKLLQPLLANIPLNRLGQPEDVAHLAAFLASPEADYITGATLYVDGGLLWNYSEQ